LGVQILKSSQLEAIPFLGTRSFPRKHW